nr:virus-like particle protein VLP2 [Venturia canescens]
MIPPLIIHCINAVELRGMTELGLYRLSGNKDRYEFLIQQFLKNDGALDLSEYDIPTITSALKQFLRSLSEPLVTYALRDTFIEAAMLPDARDRDVELGSVVMQLPQANLDTLAYLMLHLQRVSESEECKMPKSNLAKVFGPTLVGHSTGNLTPQSLIDEPKYQAAVVEALLNMPEEFWAKFIDPRKLQQRRLSELTRSQSSTQLSQLSRRPNLQGLSGSHALTPLSRPTEAAFKKRSSSDPEDLSRYGNEEIDQDDPVYENVNLRSQTVNQGQPELLYASLDLPVTNRTIKNQRNPAHAARTPWANRRFQQDEDEPLYASIMPTSNDNLYEDEPIHGEVFVGPNGEMYHKNVSF